LWQPAVIGIRNMPNGFTAQGEDNLRVLVDYLIKFYGPKHRVIVYEAPQVVLCKPLIHEVTLQELAKTEVSGLSTLYVPPLGPSKTDSGMMRRLGLKVLKKKN